MAMAQKERKQMLGLLIAIGAGAPVGFWIYWRNPQVVVAQAMQQELDSLRTEVTQARSDLQQGTVETLRETVAKFERDLEVMRELVPTGSEFTTLIDSISSRADRRGVKIISIDPQTTEFDASFQVERFRYVAIGHYDAVGAFLADIASLRRVMVPYDVSLSVALPADIQGLLMEPNYQYLRVQFMIKTFVKGEAGMESEFGVPGVPVP